VLLVLNVLQYSRYFIQSNAQFLTQQRADELSFCSYIYFFAFISVLISAAVYGKNKDCHYFSLSFSYNKQSEINSTTACC